MSWTDGNARVTAAHYEVEVEEREEQLYEADGTTPVTKTQESGTAEGKKTKVKLKRYFYRLCLKVTKTHRVAGSVGVVPGGFGGAIGETKSSMSWDGISTPSGMKFICTDEDAREIDSVTGTWDLSSSWTGYTKWKAVPKSWNMDQKTDIDDEDSGS